MATSNMGQIDVTVENHGSLFLFWPHTESAEDWITEHTSHEALWYCGALVVEPRYAQDLAAGMMNYGLKVA